MNPQVGHEIPGAEEGAQMMQLTQVQLAQIVSSVVSQALTQYVQQTANNPLIAAASSTAVVQQVQTPIKFDVPIFECDSAASGLTRSQKALCHRYVQHTHFIPIVGVGKRSAYLLVHGDLPRQHPFGTTLRFTGPVPAASRQ